MSHALTPPRPARALTGYKPFWAKRFGPAPFLPTTRREMEALGWDSCDIVIVTGDAYVDHPSFGMAVIGRVLEAQGFRVGIIPQPEWNAVESFQVLGRPNLFFGIAAGNMDSMINHYTADRRIRSDDAYTAGAAAGKRPDRATLVYTQRCQQAYKDVPVVIGGIEASLRRVAHYDYWQDKVRRSILADSKADLLVYGNAERAIVEIAHRLARREPVETMTDIRGTAFLVRSGFAPQGFIEIDSSEVDLPGRVDALPNPYEPPDHAGGNALEGPAAADPTVIDAEPAAPAAAAAAVAEQPITIVPRRAARPAPPPRDRTVIRMPSYEQVRADPVLYAHASRVLHLETNPGNARALVQRHGERDVWINPPPLPLNMPEMDHVFDLPYARSPHPRYADEFGRHDGATKIPAWEMIRFSVNIMRGCFGGCTFCSITEHEGRIIQSRSADSIVREVEQMRTMPGFTGVVSDLGGPTANMYRLGCKSPEIEAACRKPSCVYPDICQNLRTDHGPLVKIYRRVRALPGVKKVLIGSGLRYDLAVRSLEYTRELVSHHVGGYLKIAPEHTERGPLSKMMKPGIGSYDRFKQLFDQFSAEAGKKQYLIPYFIAAHPGTTDEDMMNLALWLKQNGFKADQVQTFYPSPMATATAMYHSGLNPLKGVHRDERGERVDVVRGERRRRLHKAFLRWHDPNNWPLLREALKEMGRADLIGNGKHHLIPTYQPATDGSYQSARRKNSTPSKGTVLTQHTGLPPRAGLPCGRGASAGAAGGGAARGAAPGRGAGGKPASSSASASAGSARVRPAVGGGGKPGSVAKGRKR
ncbi:YgiQ family radical SAM protein [Rubrivivax benzoatilyticus]|uniref:YgiQ family radical SAM protein n=1 Tax=Rubrivivax benzoatilyticus TaxID=316997 RepID=A0ABX0HST8_9BURK|nr:YgiQ family radical SAM protein [Rubrivivax benzoatilyticus]EGJ10836.1 Radical SAM domain-containing protein [Rubrivivax benzoatilyticus JA2 = ATCC BAA-35]NHK98105.1 YgiQ family radical SAM protein [Rubrivivax benzoatilyticus]NHL23607.1 YgiQ family radical SAM protein [Rubrivivax benzoatilyticus]